MLIKAMSKEGSHNMDLFHLPCFPHLLGILLQCVVKWTFGLTHHGAYGDSK